MTHKYLVLALALAAAPAWACTQGNDAIVVEGDRNILQVCPALAKIFFDEEDNNKTRRERAKASVFFVFIEFSDKIRTE